jgi:hypothetical protein
MTNGGRCINSCSRLQQKRFSLSLLQSWLLLRFCLQRGKGRSWDAWHSYFYSLSILLLQHHRQWNCSCELFASHCCLWYQLLLQHSWISGCAQSSSWDVGEVVFEALGVILFDPRSILNELHITCQCNDEDIRLFSGGLMSSKSSTKMLVLNGIDCRDSMTQMGWQLIYDALASNTCLQHLEISYCNLMTTVGLHWLQGSQGMKLWKILLLSSWTIFRVFDGKSFFILHWRSQVCH